LGLAQLFYVEINFGFTVSEIKADDLIKLHRRCIDEAVTDADAVPCGIPFIFFTFDTVLFDESIEFIPEIEFVDFLENERAIIDSFTVIYLPLFDTIGVETLRRISHPVVFWDRDPWIHRLYSLTKHAHMKVLLSVHKT
jgi:hypothetical protein